MMSVKCSATNLFTWWTFYVTKITETKAIGVSIYSQQWCSHAALYHYFLDKITVLPLLSEGNYSFDRKSETQYHALVVTLDMLRRLINCCIIIIIIIAHKFSPLSHCKFWDYITESQNKQSLGLNWTATRYDRIGNTAYFTYYVNIILVVAYLKWVKTSR